MTGVGPAEPALVLYAPGTEHLPRCSHMDAINLSSNILGELTRFLIRKDVTATRLAPACRLLLLWPWGRADW